jgi:hypothetical protein
MNHDRRPRASAFFNILLERFVQQDGPKKELALWLLRKWAVAHPVLAAGFMEGWWRADPDARGGEVIAWFERLYPEGPIGRLEDLYSDVVAAVPASAIKEDFAANFELGSWVHKSPPLGARILGRWLLKWMQTFPDGHPFSGYRGDSHFHWVQELVKHQPAALLEATVPTFAEALKREQAALAAGTLSYRTIQPPHYEHDQEYLRAVLQALELISVSHPDQAEHFLEVLGGDSDVAIFARLRAIAANGQGLSHLLVPLLSCERVFKVGDGDGDWLPFAEAAAAAMPHLSVNERMKIEGAILAYRPEYDWAREYARRSKADELLMPREKPGEYVVYQLTRTGRDERAILTTIGSEWLSDRAKHRLAELDRKFAGQALPEAYGVRGGWVRSPIQPDKARLMSDKQWLRAIEKYDGDERHIYEPDGVIGGARQLASVLQARAKEEPERFVALLEHLPLSARAEYAEAVVSGLRESEADGALVARAIKAARRWPDGGFNRITNWTIQRHPSAASDPEILAYLLKSAEFGTASDTAVTTTSPGKRERRTADELLRNDGDLAASGINEERGAAYEALASILWEDQSALPAVLDLLERRVDNEPLPSVGICIVHALNSVGKYEPDRAIDLLQRLVANDMRVLQGHAAMHMLGWVIHRRPDIVAEIANELLKSESISSRALGYFLESLLALLDDERNTAFVAGFAESSLRRQMAAFRAAGNVTSDRYGDRSASWLLQLFHDDDPLVRGDAAGLDWGTVLDEAKDRTDFVRAFLSSPAFDDHSDHLMRALEDRVSQLPDLTFEAVERVLDLADGWKGADRQGHYSTLHHLSRVLVELYRSVQGGSQRERDILELFDIYLARDLYEMRSEIGAYERH